MWLLERVPLTLRRYLLRVLPSPIAAKKERWQLQHSPLALFLTGFWNFEFFFWGKISFVFLLFFPRMPHAHFYPLVH